MQIPPIDLLYKLASKLEQKNVITGMSSPPSTTPATASTDSNAATTSNSSSSGTKGTTNNTSRSTSNNDNNQNDYDTSDMQYDSSCIDNVDSSAYNENFPADGESVGGVWMPKIGK